MHAPFAAQFTRKMGIASMCYFVGQFYRDGIGPRENSGIVSHTERVVENGMANSSKD